MGAELDYEEATSEESKVESPPPEFTMSIVLCSNKPFTEETRELILSALKAREVNYKEVKHRHDKLRYQELVSALPSYH